MHESNTSAAERFEPDVHKKLEATLADGLSSLHFRFVVADDRYGKMLSIFTSLVTPRNLTFSSCSPVGTLSGSLTTM